MVSHKNSFNICTRIQDHCATISLLSKLISKDYHSYTPISGVIMRQISLFLTIALLFTLPIFPRKQKRKDQPIEIKITVETDKKNTQTTPNITVTTGEKNAQITEPSHSSQQIKVAPSDQILPVVIAPSQSEEKLISEQTVPAIAVPAVAVPAIAAPVPTPEPVQSVATKPEQALPTPQTVEALPEKSSEQKEETLGTSEQTATSSISQKNTAAKELVNQGIDFLKKNTLAQACDIFSTDPAWRHGESFIFIFDKNGTCYSFGPQTDVVWKNFGGKERQPKKHHTHEKISFIPDMLKIGNQGGFVNFTWNNETMRAYVKTVEIQHNTYIVGAGFYPISAEYITEQLVQGAGKYLQHHDHKDLFSQINSPTGIFVEGDIYLYVVDTSGDCVAHGGNSVIIGQNLMGIKSSDGKYIIRDILDLVKENESGWYEFQDKNQILKRSYFLKVIDPATKKEYIIIGGYYPTINDDSVRLFINKAIAYLKANGRETAFKDFSHRTGGFVIGSMTISVYDVEGIVLADSQNPELIGLNLKNTRDITGKLITQQILDTANTYEKGWVSYFTKNSWKATYVEKVKLPDGDFIITAGYFPHAKKTKTDFMSDRASRYLHNHMEDQAFQAFSSSDSDFLQGDLHVTVYTMDGVCLVDGIDKTRIWSNDNKIKDDNGEFFVRKIIALAQSGGGWVDFPLYKAKKHTYVKPVSKRSNDKTDVLYAVCCSYFE